MVDAVSSVQTIGQWQQQRVPAPAGRGGGRLTDACRPAQRALAAAARRRETGPGATVGDWLPAHRAQRQSACLRKNAGISISSMPLLDNASTLAAAWLRLVRHTLGVLNVP